MEPVAWVAWDPAFQSAILVMIFFLVLGGLSIFT
jgi:hypothetical protein